MDRDDPHKENIIKFLTKYLGIDPEKHVSPFAKKLIALSIAFALILSTLVYIGKSRPEIIIDWGIASKLQPTKKKETFRWPWLSEDELTTSGGKK